MNLDISQEVREFIEEIKNAGMDLKEYTSKIKLLRKKINLYAKAKLKILDCVKYEQLITEEQYKKFKKFFEEERTQYHKILNNL